MNSYAKIFTLFIGVVTLQTTAQETVKKATVLNHPKKVYTDNQRERLYWPLDKPFWIKLADSPDSTAKSYSLSHDIDSTKPDSEVQLSKAGKNEGVRLDVSGRQSLKWFNMTTGEKHSFRFFSDGDAPICMAKVVNVQPFTSSNKTYYGKGANLELSANDKGSGVEQILVSINNAPYHTYTNPISFATEMSCNISYYAVDNVGNAGNPIKAAFIIDLTAPQTNPAFSKSFSGKDSITILSRSNTITLTSIDSLSGVKEVFYQFGADTKYLSYVGPVSLRNFKDGQYTFTFYSIDNAGNEESKRSLKFNIDNAPPIPDVALEGDLFGFKNGQIVISSRTLMKASAIDSLSNIEKIEYSVNNGVYALYNAPLPVSSLPGKHIVNVRATDNVGNMSNPVAVTVTIDIEPPKSKHTFIGPIYQNNGMTCISPETKIELKAQDDLAGVANIKYSSDGENSTEYLAPISITKEGSSILKYRGTDKVNNQEETQVIALFLDKTPPTIVESFGSKKLNDGEIAHYPKGTTLFLQATDNSSGLKGIWYSINGGNESKYDNALKITRKGEHKIIVRAQDNVGMTTVKTISFVIEDTKK